jgi:hypothetical protein
MSPPKHRLNSSSYLSLLYLRQFLVEDLFPDNILDKLDFLNDKESFSTITSGHSRPECVRNLLIHIYKTGSDDDVKKFVEVILQHERGLLPQNAEEVFKDENELLRETISLRIHLIPENHYARPNLCKEAVEWIKSYEKREFGANQQKPILLVLYGIEYSGKSSFSIELYECDEMREHVPLSGVIKLEMYDEPDFRTIEDAALAVYEMVKEGVKHNKHVFAKEKFEKTGDEKLVEIRDEINRIMSATARPAERILLIIDHADYEHYKKSDFENYFTYTNVITMVATSDENLANQFDKEARYKLPDTFTDDEWHGLLKQYIKDWDEGRMQGGCDTIAKRVGLSPYNLSKLGRHLCTSGPADRVMDRLNYFVNIPKEKLEGYIKYYHF